MLSSLPDNKFWAISVEESARLLETDLERGLSAAEARARLEIFGLNTLDTSHKSNKLKIFFSQLKSPLIIILIAAGLLTLFIAHYRDSAFIFIAVIVNSILGFWQENKAENALDELKTYLKQRTRVIRDGQEKEIDAEYIVPGDILRLSQGDRVPADARIIFANDFQVDESVLTGESLSVSKSALVASVTANITDQKSMVFAGTLITQGVAAAVVCRTDTATELGKIAALIAQSDHEPTPLQKSITKFSAYLSLLLGILTLIVFVIGLLAGKDWLEMLLTAVAMAVSAIPEGLPISMTVVLAIGVERMAKRRGVVRKLIAAETLGGTTVILTDKTGTLTMARMMLSRVIGRNIDERQLLLRALSNTDVLVENPEDEPETWRMNGRIMEISLVRSAALRGFKWSEISDKSHVLQALPFNAVNKFSVSLIKEGDKHLLVLFGAPDILLSRSSLPVAEKQHMMDQINNLAISGERVLGLATKEITSIDNFSLSTNLDLSALSFDGLLTFSDPIRPGLKSVVDRVRQAGIKIVIMTGDHQGTATAVARHIGLDVDAQSILDASELANLSDESLRHRLPELAVVSRVTPFDKMRLVKLFQEAGEVVAMTGDGVNDAPSIKQANVGIAMGSGTEVSRSVADLVLLDDNFETIVAAIEEGRQILRNIRKVLVYLLSSVTDELILIGASIVLGLPLPLNALQILWVNFFTDSFPAVAFAFERDNKRLSRQVDPSAHLLFTPLMKFLIIVIGISTSALLFIIYLLGLKNGVDDKMLRTFIFAAFGTYTLLLAVSVRSLEDNIVSYRFFSNPYLSLSILFGLCLMAAAIYVPVLQGLFDTVALPAIWVAGVLGVGLLNIVLIEMAKYLFNKFRS